jgi:hypothetical protein
MITDLPILLDSSFVQRVRYNSFIATYAIGLIFSLQQTADDIERSSRAARRQNYPVRLLF